MEYPISGGLLLLLFPEVFFPVFFLCIFFFFCVWRSLKWSYRFSLSFPLACSFSWPVYMASFLQKQHEKKGRKKAPTPLCSVLANSLAILMAADRTSPFFLLLLLRFGCSANCNYFFFSPVVFFASVVVAAVVAAFLLAQ